MLTEYVTIGWLARFAVGSEDYRILTAQVPLCLAAAERRANFFDLRIFSTVHI